MKGVMSVIVKCTLIFEDKLDKVSKEIGEKLERTSDEIRDFNESTTKLNKRLFWLNGILAAATILGAFATLKLSGII